MRRNPLVTAFSLALLALLACPAAAAPPAPVLAGFPTYVEKAIGDWRVPGCAVGVVRDGKVVLLRGFGVRETGKPEKVDADTIFQIASLTKGFTAGAVGKLVEEGKLGWDDRLTERLAELRLSDPAVQGALTIRDAVAHRSGLGDGADLSWALSGTDRTESIRRLRFVPQAGRLGTESYQNVLVTAVGEAAARANGTSWEELVSAKLIRPLSLRRTFASFREIPTGDANVAVPHSDLAAGPLAIPFERGIGIAPSAAIQSTAADMLRWLSMFVGRGEIDGKRVLAAETVEELTTPTTLQAIGPAGGFFRSLYPETHFLAWGLGWVVQDFRGRLVVWNTGGLDGMATSIAFVPEERLAIVVLTNGPRISLPEALVFRVIDELTAPPGTAPRDWSGIRLESSLARRKRQASAVAAQEAARIRGTKPTLPATGYAGIYGNDLLGDVSVEARGGGLFVKIGAGLSGPAEHWHHDTFRVTWPTPLKGTSLATFQLGADGRPERMQLEDVGELERR